MLNFELGAMVGDYSVSKRMKLPAVPRPNEIVFVRYGPAYAGCFVERVDYYEDCDKIDLDVRFNLGEAEHVVQMLREGGWTVDKFDPD